MLSDRDVRDFVVNGFVRIERAFPGALAARCREALWQASGCDPRDRRTWTHPVVRIWQGSDGRGGSPLAFAAAANTPVLCNAYDRLVGEGRWQARADVGNFVLRFPSRDDPGDAGWHVDLSFPGPGGFKEDHDYSSWRVNVHSRGRALLMLFLFTDVGKSDAPTRLRIGSHHDVARLLAPAGEAGMSHLDLQAVGASREVAVATGRAGTVFLCHPFLVHSAQPHRGRHPRFISQPPLTPSEPLCLERRDGKYSPVEAAIRIALA